jgi:hypothetical protein
VFICGFYLLEIGLSKEAFDMIAETEISEAPPVDPEAFKRLRSALESTGPQAAIEQLISDLRSNCDYSNLFYALLLKKRVELGVSPFPTGPSSELPPHTHETYEQAIREAGREVGHALLSRRQFGQAWSYFRMLGEPDPVREALEKYAPGPDEDVYPVIEIAWQGGVLPRKGFDLVLDRHGVCSAITMVSSSDMTGKADLRDYCVGRLVRALHFQLHERLQSDLAARGVVVSAGTTITRILDDHPELFVEDSYHIDTSHLSSVVQMSTYLPPGPENDLARELCAYGCKLSPGLQGANDAPFDENYRDYLAFLNVIAGIEIANGLERFRAKAEREAAEGATYSAQVYVNLLLRSNHPAEALVAAKQYLITQDERNLICPGVFELARRTRDFEAMAEAAQARNDPVNYLAGLIAGRE